MAILKIKIFKETGELNQITKFDANSDVQCLLTLDNQNKTVTIDDVKGQNVVHYQDGTFCK